MFEEELLEPIARLVRFNQSLEDVPRNKPIRLVDIGCGPRLPFYDFTLKHNILCKEYIGIDPLLIPDSQENKRIKILKSPLEKTIPLDDNIAEYVVGFAFLEHIDYPASILNEVVRILIPGGKAIFTTPTPIAKGVLEFLSYRLGLISAREIKEHKHYFYRKDLINLIDQKNKPVVTYTHRYFEVGMNNYFVLTKHL